jgi:anti-anti-sigma factor
VPGKGGGPVEESALTIDVEADHSSVTLVLAGELDLASAPSLRACLDSLDGGWRLIVLDLADLAFMDSTGLALLAQLHTRTGGEASRIDVELRNPRPGVFRLLELAGFHEVFKITGRRSGGGVHGHVHPLGANVVELP